MVAPISWVTVSSAWASDAMASEAMQAVRRCIAAGYTRGESDGDPDADAGDVRERGLPHAVAERQRERRRAGDQLVQRLERGDRAGDEHERARGAAPAHEFVRERRGEHRVR